MVDAPRFEGCRACGQRQIMSPLTRLLPARLLPELRHLQGKLAAELSYRRAAELLRELLPQTGGDDSSDDPESNSRDRHGH